MSCRRRKFPFCVFSGYRWCGPGCSGPGQPINDVDSCCYKQTFVLSVVTPLVTVIKSFWNAFIPKGIPIPKRADKQMSCIIS